MMAITMIALYLVVAIFFCLYIDFYSDTCAASVLVYC